MENILLLNKFAIIEEVVWARIYIFIDTSTEFENEFEYFLLNM